MNLQKQEWDGFAIDKKSKVHTLMTSKGEPHPFLFPPIISPLRSALSDLVSYSPFPALTYHVAFPLTNHLLRGHLHY